MKNIAVLFCRHEYNAFTVIFRIHEDHSSEVCFRFGWNWPSYNEVCFFSDLEMKMGPTH